MARCCVSLDRLQEAEQVLEAMISGWDAVNGDEDERGAMGQSAVLCLLGQVCQ